MAWIEVHQSLREHRKMFACAEMLNLSRKEMIGTLISLWLWALDNTRNGNLDGVSIRTIASVCDWPEKKADKLVDALRTTGWIDTSPDGCLSIHDWTDYAGKLIERREKDRERKQRTKRKPLDGSRISSGNPAEILDNSVATVPNRTLPYHNRTNSNTDGDKNTDCTGVPDGAPVRFDGKHFTVFWDAYPCKIGREAAWDAWRGINPDKATVEKIMSALASWKASERWQEDKGRYIPRGAKWLSEGYWRSPPELMQKENNSGRELDSDEAEAIKRMMEDGDAT